MTYEEKHEENRENADLSMICPKVASMWSVKNNSCLGINNSISPNAAYA